jgi:tight adherence protein B
MMETTGSPILFPLGCLLMGLAVGTVAWSAQGEYSRALAFVERDLTDKLRRLRAPTHKVHSYLVAWLGLTAVIFLGFWLVLESPIFAVMFSVFLLCGPWYMLRRMAQQRRQKIEDQLADAMVMLANAVRAGLSLAQAMDVLASQCPSPINHEFRQIVGEYNMGKPLEQTLEEARARLRSENFALFAAAMMASHQSGGRLNEIVERIAQSVLELQRLERKVQSETAQARKSAVYMAIAPVLILVVYYFVAPESTVQLFTEPFGHVLLATAVVLNVLAYFWARFILSPDI